MDADELLKLVKKFQKQLTKTFTQKNCMTLTKMNMKSTVAVPVTAQ